MLNGCSSRDSVPAPVSANLPAAKDDGEMYASFAGSESGKVSDIFFAAD
jgi:hypothetical protein